MSTLPKYVYFVPFLFSISAFFVAFFGTPCYFLEFTSLSTTPITLRFGLFYYQSLPTADSTTMPDGGSCTMYPTSGINVDGNWTAARVFYLIQVILGGSIIMLDMFMGCRSTNRKRSFRMGAACYLVCSFCAGMSLLMLQSNVCKNNTLIDGLNGSLPGVQFPDACSISKGAKSMISSCVLWFVASVGTAYLHPGPKNEEENNNDGLDEPLFDSNDVTL